MSVNLGIAKKVIAECNLKFSAGSGNARTSFLDGNTDHRANQLEAARKELKTAMKAESNRSVLPKRELTGKLIDERRFTIGNCGERSCWVLYKLRQQGVRNVWMMTGDPEDSINHDFVVIGAGNIKARDTYSIYKAPPWSGDDVVICDPWYQAETFGYTHGLAYGLSQWPKYMPAIVGATLMNKSVALNSFELTCNE